MKPAQLPGLGAPVRIVLADANVLYSRVLRDYLLYASAEDLISVRWSQQILDEMTRHLIKNVPAFDDAAAATLVRLMNENFTSAFVEPAPEHYERFSDLHMPDTPRSKPSPNSRKSGPSHLIPGQYRDELVRWRTSITSCVSLADALQPNHVRQAVTHARRRGD